MLQVKMKKVAENPFYGKSALKSLLNEGKKCPNKVTMVRLLDNAWKEAETSKEAKELFFIICFAIGDITNRQHNIFNKNKVNNGGDAARIQFMWIMSWLRKVDLVQYYKFMFARIINEFVSFFVILACQVRTIKGKKTIDEATTDAYSALLEQDLNKVAEFLAGIILKGSIIDKMMLAKWLVLPRYSKRQKFNRDKSRDGQRDLQEQTKKRMQAKESLLVLLSKKLNWEIIQYPNNKQFKGFNNWRKEYNQSLESVLFSTKKICSLDKEQFFTLLEQCPSGARYRIQRRLMDKDGNSKKKWFRDISTMSLATAPIDLSVWFKEWEKFKETKQKEQRDLAEKIRQGDESEETKIAFEKVKKEGKVNVGGSSLFDLCKNILTSTDLTSISIAIQSLMDKVDFKVPVGVIGDISGSMGERIRSVEGMLPYQISTLIATLVMLKNPSTDMDNILVTFGDKCTIYTDRSKVEVKQNKFMTGKEKVVERIIDRTKDFIWNYNNLLPFLGPKNQGTHLSCVAQAFKDWVDSDADLKSVRIEQLQSILVWIVVSDGDLNSDRTAAESMRRFQSILESFGCSPVIVVLQTPHSMSDPFEHCPNVITMKGGWNIGNVNSLFTNIHDLDVIDTYSELKSLWLSDRYIKVKEQVI